MVQSRLSAHIRPHAGGSSGLGGVGQWRQSQSASATYGGAYLDLSGSPSSLHRLADHAAWVPASGPELGADAAASVSFNKTRALDSDLDAQGDEAAFAHELAQVQHVCRCAVRVFVVVPIALPLALLPVLGTSRDCLRPTFLRER